MCPVWLNKTQNKNLHLILHIHSLTQYFPHNKIQQSFTIEHILFYFKLFPKYLIFPIIKDCIQGNLKDKIWGEKKTIYFIVSATQLYFSPSMKCNSLIYSTINFSSECKKKKINIFNTSQQL